MTNTALLREFGDSKNWNFEIHFTEAGGDAFK